MLPSALTIFRCNMTENLVQRVPKIDVFMGVDELQVGMRFLAETDQGPYQ